MRSFHVFSDPFTGGVNDIYINTALHNRGRLPDKVQSLFTDNKIAAVHCLALGDNENFFIAYKSKDDGRNRCRESISIPEMH